MMTEKELRREVLVDTARDIFFEYGVRKTTIDDIAQACGMTKSSLYHYFSGKEDLIRAVAGKVLEENLAEFRRVVQKDQPLVDSLRSLINCVVERQQEMHPKFISSIEEVMELIPMLKDIITSYQQSLYSMIRERLDRAVDSGEFKNLPVNEFTSIVMILVHHQVKQCTDNTMQFMEKSDPGTMVSLLLDPYRG